MTRDPYFVGFAQMMLLWSQVFFASLALAAPPQPATEAPACGKFLITAEGLDLAPPVGFVGVCTQNDDLCQQLTAGYPEGVHTLGYFVLPEEWERYKKSPISFTRYLIAQQAGAMSPADLPGLKEYIRSQQGAIPDHSKLTSLLNSEGTVPTGVFEDTDDSIAFGVLMKLRPTVPGPLKDLGLASTNAALVVKGKVLTLYAFWDVSDTYNPEPVQRLTLDWLRCMRAANKP